MLVLPVLTVWNIEPEDGFDAKEWDEWFPGRDCESRRDRNLGERRSESPLVVSIVLEREEKEPLGVAAPDLLDSVDGISSEDVRCRHK